MSLPLRHAAPVSHSMCGLPAADPAECDLRRRAVAVVGDPERAVAVGDADRPAPDLDRSSGYPAPAGVDAHHGSVVRIGHPCGTVGNDDLTGIVANTDRVSGHP